MSSDFLACFDLETSSLSADFGVVLCGVVKPWQGKARVYRIDELAGDVPSDDHLVVAALIEALSQYDILVAHNGVRFDRPYLNTRALKWGLPLLNPFGKIIDPVQHARRYLRMGGNSLANVAKTITKHQKSSVDGNVWVRAAMDRDKEAMDTVVKHCIKDVVVLEAVTERLRPFIKKIDERGSY